MSFVRRAPALLDTRAPRQAQKQMYGGELFPAEFPADATGNRFLEFFQIDREGNAKGIIVIDLVRLE